MLQQEGFLEKFRGCFSPSKTVASHVLLENKSRFLLIGSLVNVR
jgi:hypothetical protein